MWGLEFRVQALPFFLKTLYSLPNSCGHELTHARILGRETVQHHGVGFRNQGAQGSRFWCF